MANPTRRTPGLRSQSPTGRFASSTSAFTTTTSFFQNHRSASPTRVNLYGSSSSSSSTPSTYSLSLHNRQMSVMPRGGSQTAAVKKQLQAPKRMCMCSPTSHPGSFRCSLHKSNNNNNNNNNSANNTTSYPSNRLNARRSAMTNSLVRIGTVEGGDLVKRALSALIRPSSHQQRRRTSFQPTPSRLSVMTY